MSIPPEVAVGIAVRIATMDYDTRRAIALWRMSVLGPLVSARLEHGDRRAYFEQAAARRHERPDGMLVTLSPRTIEQWFYAHRRGGLNALMPRTRSDRGHSRVIDDELTELIVRCKREKPRRSIRRIIRMLERAKRVRNGQLSRSSVHRLLSERGISSRPVRGPSTERRSFILEFAGDLWLGDALHGPVVIAPDGRLRKAYLLSEIDCATRFIVHSYFVTSEGAVAQEYGLKQALLKYGRPRAYYVDRGAAYVARSLKAICAELDIELKHAGPRDAEAKGAIERWHRRWRDEVGDELPDHPIALSELNAIHWAWLSTDYHRTVHDTTQRAPREHFLEQVRELRPLPRGKNLDEVFLHRDRRKVRKDNTVRFHGGYLEVRPELCGQWVELRFDPSDPDARPCVYVEGKFVCDTVPLDRIKNATRRRRRLKGDPAPDAEPSGLDPLEQIKDEHYQRTRLSAEKETNDDE